MKRGDDDVVVPKVYAKSAISRALPGGLKLLMCLTGYKTRIERDGDSLHLVLVGVYPVTQPRREE